MRFFVLNSSGNVGKTTVTRELLYSFLDNPKIIEIETVNSSSEHFKSMNVEKIEDFTNFEEIYLKIIETDNLIVDIGASNLSAFMEKISEFAGVETLFDLFIIPTVAGDKVATDTARTILFLKELGIEDEKIKVIFNNALNIEEFDILLKQEKRLDFKFDRDLFIPKSKLFMELGIIRKTINEIYNEDVNAYKELILNAEPKEKMRLIKQDLCNRMAVSIYPTLRTIFEKITGLEAVSNVAEIEANKAETKNENSISDDDEEL